MKARIEEHEVPYQTLAKYGLTREMIEDLPMHVLEMTQTLSFHQGV